MLRVDAIVLQRRQRGAAAVQMLRNVERRRLMRIVGIIVGGDRRVCALALVLIVNAADCRRVGGGGAKRGVGVGASIEHVELRGAARGGLFCERSLLAVCILKAPRLDEMTVVVCFR